MLLKDCISVECALTLIISTLLAIGIAAIQQSWMPSQRYPSSIQWVGRRVERFSYFRACLRHFIYKPDLLDYGYRNVS
jgi:hypothetical protein